MRRTTPALAGSETWAGARGLGDRGRRAQLGQAPAERVAVPGEVPDVAAEHELGRELGRERDPAAERAQRPLDDVAVGAQAPRGILDREVPCERVRHERSVDLRPLRGPDQPLDLFLAEARQAAHVGRDRDRDGLVLALAPHPAEVEALAARLLELDRAAAAL